MKGRRLKDDRLTATDTHIKRYIRRNLVNKTSIDNTCNTDIYRYRMTTIQGRDYLQETEVRGDPDKETDRATESPEKTQD